MTANKLHVMVVDDSVVVLEHLRFALERSGHFVSTRDSALGTVGVVMKTRPDVLVLDVSMPALDGDRLAMVITGLRRNIILILHSSLEEGKLRDMAKATGAHGFIPKTPDVRQFLAEFDRIVFGGALQRQSTRR
jgi:CheY-like chemotaxis protein